MTYLRQTVVVGVGVLAVAEEIKVLAHAGPRGSEVLEHHYAVLHRAALHAVADLRAEINGGEIHQHEQLPPLQVAAVKSEEKALRLRDAAVLLGKLQLLSLSGVKSSTALKCSLR